MAGFLFTFPLWIITHEDRPSLSESFGVVFLNVFTDEDLAEKFRDAICPVGLVEPVQSKGDFLALLQRAQENGVKQIGVDATEGVGKITAVPVASLIRSLQGEADQG